ncbi:MAG: cation-translocating P-type ATPase [Rhodocyclaceae bacterium]|nr:cation-translocating P-type ATPase [Rhodocyclaceae bacterium]
MNETPADARRSAEFPPGLSAAAVRARQAAEGYNEMAADQSRSLARISADIVREPMFLLLLGAGGIYLLMGDAHEALILLGFVVVIMALTIVQERRTERALEALRDLSSPRALVMRDGRPLRIPGREVVRDDVLILTEGDRVPADGAVLSAHELAADESLLTGESVPVQKAASGAARDSEASAAAGRVFAGTLVTAGQGLVRVTAIGAASELGRIGKSLATIGSETSPLQREIGALARRLAVIGLGLCVVVTLLYVAARGGWLDGLLAGITLAMGILPQEFPVILIVFLALGARRIASARVLTRRLAAIETLGETTVLCVDKTGTLTQNRMAVAALCAGERRLVIDDEARLRDLPEPFHELLEYCVLASEITPHDPMEQAFHRLAREHLANTEHLHPDWSLAREYELSPDLPAMSHLWRIPDRAQHAVATKGAPEAIVDLCHLDAAARQRVLAAAAAMAGDGLRVLGVAKATHRGDAWPALQHDFDFAFVGLVGLADPLRPEVPAAIAECRSDGIRVMMITGDHPRTALAIARDAGLAVAQVLTGAELAALTPAELAARLHGDCVFARVTPGQKLRLVDALKAQGEVVAMTGDGVNDAPALKAAHIGIAMGKRGTDVAREAADLVLLEDDFDAIVRAVRLGRRIFANLRQAMIYTLAVHVPIIGLSILPLLFGLPLVLAPIHIAFLELIIDPACSIVFEAEEASAKLMAQPPRRRAEPLVASRHIALSLVQGAMTTMVVIVLYWVSLRSGTPAAQARTLAFVALVAANCALIFSSRSVIAGVGNALRDVAPIGYRVVAGTFVALIAVTAIPPLAAPFAFAGLSAPQWLGAAAAGVSALLLFEAAKAIVGRRQA